MKKLFCKHRYTFEVAQVTTPTTIKDISSGKIIQKQVKCGAIVFCTKCGKINKRLSTQISKMWTNKCADQTEWFNKELTKKYGDKK